MSSCSAAAVLFTSQLGILISNIPNRLKANTTSNSPMKALNATEAEIACIPTAPNTSDTTTPSTVNVVTMEPM